jgi:hypothetical protein
MDCSTARLFLQFQRPNAWDLDGPEAQELEEHLAHCTECNTLARAARRLDGHLGRAMRAVEVPEGLRTQILRKLAAERSDWYRRWFGRATRGLVAAAALLLVLGGAYSWWYFRPARLIDPFTVAQDFNVRRPDLNEVNRMLKSRGSAPCAPDFVNYAYLTGQPAVVELPGYENVEVPQLVFTHPDRGTERRAVILVLNDQKFRVGDIENDDHGYKYRLEVYKDPDPDSISKYTYLVLYTGDDWNWLKVERSKE